MILLRSLEIPAFKHVRDIELAFPPTGAVLIEGPNESGKSTLFEAVYFALYGAPLVSEEGRSALAAILPHDGPMPSVALTLQPNDAEMQIRRTVRRRQGEPAGQEAHLLIRRSGARPEEVAGADAVNARILAELHGLDGDALRMSCLVEQGGLGRVEALSRAAREDVIARLLGIERLVGIERDLAPSDEERAALEGLRTELRLAAAARSAEDAAAREAEAADGLRGARTRALIAERDTLADQHADHADQDAAMRSRSAELEGHIARAGQVAALLTTLDATEPDLLAGHEAETAARLTRERQDDLDRIEREAIPAAEARIAELRGLETDLSGAEEARAAVTRAQQVQRVSELDARLGRLDELMPALAAHEAAQGDLAQAQEAYRLARAEATARASVGQAKTALKTAEVETQTAQTAVDRANVRDILAYWVRLKEIEDLKRGDAAMEEIARQRDKIARRVGRLHRREVTASIFAIIFALAAIATALAAFKGWGPAQLLFAASGAIVVVWLCAVIFFFALVGGRRSETRLRDTERRLTLASIRSEAANLLGGSIEDLPQVEADLQAAGASIPADVEAGRTVLAGLTGAEPASLADLEERVRDTLLRAERHRIELANAEAQRESAERERAERNLWLEIPVGEVERRLADAERNAARTEAAARALIVEPFTWPVARATVQATNTELAAQRAQAAQGLGITTDEPIELTVARGGLSDAQSDLARRTASIEARLTALGLPGEPSAVAAARGGAEAESTRLRERLSERESLAAAMDEHTARAQSAHAALSPAIQAAWGQAAALALLPADVAPSEHTNLAAVGRNRETLRLAASTTLQGIDERAHRDELAGLRAQLAAHGDRGATLAERREASHQQIATLFTERGLAARGDEPLDALVALWPALGVIGPDEVEAREQALAAANRETHFARRTADELARQHGYDEARLAALDEAECQRHTDDAERALRQRELAMSLARGVRTRIVRRVLPETEAHMRALVPELTAGRYHDAQLVRDESARDGADLRIRVWDQAAGRYVSKSLFSGGTRDQLSLALRLAFVLATLPKELDAMPGFLFLDESLGAADAERAEALVRVLTEGTLAQTFPQIFLVSHDHTFDAGAFRYAVRMESGGVLESTLPDASEAARLWQAETAPARAASRA